MKNGLSVAFVLASLGLLGSCGGGGGGNGGSGNGGGSIINVAGNWQFTAASTVFDLTTIATGQVNQNGSSLSGNLDLSGTPCADTANFTGTISGTNLRGALDENGQNVTMMGMVSPDGNSGSGTYTTPAGGCTNGDQGTLTGQRLSMLNGTFSGPLGPENSVPANLIARLRDDGGKVTGSAVMTNSRCVSSLNIAGTVSGYNVLLRGVDDQDAARTIDLRGTFDRRNESLTLTYAVSGGNCSGETGTGQLRSVK
jgi:hypothetical protein